MKILSSLFCFCLLFISACGKVANPQNSEIKSPITNSYNLQSKFDKPILEVTSNFWGMTWINGEVIDIRLFKDGIVEYDVYPTTSKIQIKAEDVKVRKQIKISDEQVKNFIDFLTSKEFLSAKDKYTKSNCFAYDAGRDIKVNLDIGNLQKQIVVTGYCDILPKQISQLLERIEKTTNQNLE